MARSGAGQRALWHFDYAWQQGAAAATDVTLLQECSTLFSGHYGTWGPEGPKPGERVRRQPAHIAQLLNSPDARLATARYDDELVGYAIALQLTLDGDRRIAWVTQLVVHGSYRNARVATHLLYSIWHFSDGYAYGLVTANPLAVRALETATRRTCKPALITARANKVLPSLAAAAPYIPSALVRQRDGRPAPRVDTDFFVSRDDMPALRERAARAARPWALGDLEPGEEWFAVTFGDQEPSPMTEDEIADLLRGADDIWIQAYELMSLDQDHRWRAHTDPEIRFVLDATELAEGRALDVGCGDGRHTAALAAAGFDTVGVDVAAALIQRAQAQHPEVRFEHMDARRSLPDGPFDLVLCLYDVLGSSADPTDDQRILGNVYAGLRPGGWLALSVMNETVIAGRIPPQNRPASHRSFVQALERLRPSQAMETTGHVFDPANILAFQGVYYRKEQFTRPGAHLPTELVVRDRRFTSERIQQIVNAAGFELQHTAAVQTGNWDRTPRLDAHDSRAKEWLVLARRPPA